MDIGIGLPSTIPGTDGRTLLAWARRAEQRGFSSLATLDRIAYPNYDSLIAMAAADAAPMRDGVGPIRIGDTTDESSARAVRWGIGWTSGGGGPDMAAQFAERVRKAWKEAGRAGEPRIVALNYYALGDSPEAAQGGYLR